MARIARYEQNEIVAVVLLMLFQMLTKANWALIGAGHVVTTKEALLRDCMITITRLMTWEHSILEDFHFLF